MGYAPLEEPVGTRLGDLGESRSLATGRSTAAGAAPCLPKISRRLCRPPARVCKVCCPCMVCLPSTHCRWAQPAVSLLLPFCLSYRGVRQSKDTQTPEQR